MWEFAMVILCFYSNLGCAYFHANSSQNWQRYSTLPKCSHMERLSKTLSVTTCLAISSSGIICDKNWLGRRITRQTVIIGMDRDGRRRPILVKFVLWLPSLPSTIGRTNPHRHDGPSCVFVPTHFNSKIWVLGSTLWTLRRNCNTDRHK